MRLLIVGLLSFFVVSVSTGCDNKTDRKNRYLNQGKEQLEAKNYDKARISFKNVLQIDPNDLEGLYQFGKLNEAKQEFQQAFGFYNKVLELNPNHVAANLAIAKFYLAGNVLDKAEASIAVVLAVEPNSPDALVLRAALLTRKSDNNGATAIIDGVLAKNPQHREALAMKIGMHTDANEDDKAQTILDTARNSYPNDVTFLSLQSRLYKKLGKDDLAWDTFEKIAQIEPNNFAKTSEIVKLFIQNKQHDRAIALVDKFLAINPEHIDSKISKAEILYLIGRPNDAISLLKGYAGQYPKEFRFALTMASFNLQEGKRTEAIDQLITLTTAASGDPAALRAQNLLSRVYLEDKNFDAAQKAADFVLTQNPRDLDALEVRGALALGKRDFTRAISDFRAVIADKPQQAKLYPLLANAHATNGESELAVSVLREGVKANPDSTLLHTELARFLQRSNDTEGAKEHFEAAFKLDSTQAQVLDSLVNIYLTQNNGGAIRKLTAPLETDNLLGRLARYYNALSYTADKDYSKAIAAFDQLLVEKADFIEVISARVKTQVQMGQSQQARTFLSQQAAKFPNDAVIFNLLGELALTANDLPKAIEAFQTAIKLKDTWVVPYSHLANAQRKSNNITAAENTLQTGLQKQPNNFLLLNDLASLYEANAQHDKAINLYQTFYNNNGQPEVVGNNLAMLLATYKSDAPSNAQALTLAERLRTTKNPLFLDTAGWVYFKQGRITDAKNILKDAQSKFDSPVINYHLGAVYLAEQDKTSAKFHLEKARSTPNNYPGRADAEALLKTIAQE